MMMILAARAAVVATVEMVMAAVAAMAPETRGTAMGLEVQKDNLHGHKDHNKSLPPYTQLFTILAGRPQDVV